MINITVFNILTILICFYPFAGSVKRILKGVYSSLHIFVVVFFIAQTLPLVAEVFFANHSDAESMKNLYLAIADYKTSIIYNFLIIFGSWFLFFFANKRLKKAKNKKYKLFGLSNKRISVFLKKNSSILSVLLIVPCLLPIIVSLFAPNPFVYLEFSYLYTHDVDVTSSIYSYHYGILQIANWVAIVSILLFYYIARKSVLKNIFVIFSIVALCWIDGKRALLVFVLLGVLAVDIIKKTFKSTKHFAFKVILISLLVFGYFYIYSLRVQKGTEESFYLAYNSYFARVWCVKTSIYATITHGKIVDYPFQTILFIFLFFVPRTIWPEKPFFFCKYFTKYAYAYDGGFLSWNLHVNIFTEFIANIGIFGFFLALVFVLFVSAIIDNSAFVATKIFGLLFVSLYFLFGYETLTIVSFIALILSSAYETIGYKKKARLNQAMIY